MLTYIGVENLRSAGGEQGISLAPMTIVMGRNSSGKSTLIRSLFLLRQTAEARDRATAAVFEGAYAQFGSFHDFAYRHQAGAKVGVRWGFRSDGIFRIPIPQEDTEGPVYLTRNLMPGPRLVNLELNARFSLNRRSTEVRSEDVHLRVELHATAPRGETPPKSILELTRHRLDNTWSEIAYSSDTDDNLRGSYKIRRTGKFYDLSIGLFHGRQRRSGPYRQQNLSRIANTLSAFLENEAQKLILLGPLRTPARRFYLLTGERPQNVGLEGDKSIELLWMAQKTSKGIVDFLRRWLRALDISVDIKLRRVARTSLLSVELTDPKTGTRVELADVGVGASQVVPILIGGYMAPRGATLVIEQPELHLHPAAQAEMADALIQLMEGGRRILVETHSEHLVRRVQRRIAEQSLNTTRVALYYVDRTEDGSHIVPIALDERGSFLSDNLPEGFFDVDFRETEAITSAWRSKNDG